MSTRSCIARRTGVGTWTGVYHHWDGYPPGLGRYLWEHLQPHATMGTLAGELTKVIDDHPRGWSSLMSLTPECFCHSREELQKDDKPELDHTNAAACGCEYAYVFDVDNNTLEVLSSYSDDGRKMIGMFGSGDSTAKWRRIAMIDLTVSDPPDWDSM